MLVFLLKKEIRDTHVEARRTEGPGYQDRVHHQETLLRGLLHKMQEV
jgi:hypothetical protein